MRARVSGLSRVCATCVLATVLPALNARAGIEDGQPPVRQRYSYVQTFARKLFLREGSPSLSIAGYAGEDYRTGNRLNPNPSPTSFRLFRRCRPW